MISPNRVNWSGEQKMNLTGTRLGRFHQTLAIRDASLQPRITTPRSIGAKTTTH
jgi:hypothetical protein